MANYEDFSILYYFDKYLIYDWLLLGEFLPSGCTMAKAQRIDFEDLKARADFRAVLLHYGLTIVGQIGARNPVTEGLVVAHGHRELVMPVRVETMVSTRSTERAHASCCTVSARAGCGNGGGRMR